MRTALSRLGLAVSTLAVAFSLEACHFMEGPGASLTTQSVSTDDQIISFRVAPSDGDSITELTLDGLPAGQYLFLVAGQPFSSRADVISFDMTKCVWSPAPATTSATAPICAADALVPSGAQAEATLVTVTDGQPTDVSPAPVRQITAKTNDKFWYALRRLDGPLPTNVTVEAWNMTDSSGASDDAPRVDAVTLL